MLAPLAALTLSLSPQQADPATHRPDVIRYEQSTMQRDFLVFWTMTAEGRLIHRSVDPMGRGIDGAIELGADRFGQLVELLAPLDRPEQACVSGAEVWGSQTSVTWVTDGSARTLTLGQGCQNPRIVEDIGLAREADRLVQGWIATASR